MRADQIQQLQQRQASICSANTISQLFKPDSNINCGIKNQFFTKVIELHPPTSHINHQKSKSLSIIGESISSNASQVSGVEILSEINKKSMLLTNQKSSFYKKVEMGLYPKKKMLILPQLGMKLLTLPRKNQTQSLTNSLTKTLMPAL